MNTLAIATKEQGPGFRDLLAIVRRRRKPILLTLVTGLVVTLLLVLLIPPRYQSTAVILIEQQEIPQDLVRSTVTSYADERVQIISQRVMTTQNLLGIVKRFDLYVDRQQRDSRERLIQRMRDDIDFQMISADVVDPRSGLPRQATIAFSVSYTNRSPQVASKVANELTTLYLNENLATRNRLAADTTNFLEEEASRLATEITGLESRLAEFKEKNVSALPEITQLNYQVLDRTGQEVRDVQTRISSLDQQRVYLEAQLAMLEPSSSVYTEGGERVLSATDRLKILRSDLTQAQARYASDHPDVVRLSREISGLEAQQASTTQSVKEQRRSALQAELTALRERYSEDHPDVKAVQRQLDELASQRKIGGSATIDDADNPAYIQVRAQLNAVLEEKASLIKKQATLHGVLSDYESKLEKAPHVEREYREILRDYENARRRYDEVRDKQMQASLAQNLESDRKGERFTLIEPPLPPQEPVSPNRLAILILGTILTLAFAAVGAAIHESLDTSVRSRIDLAEYLAAPVLAALPVMRSPSEIVRGRRRIWMSAMAGSASLVAIVVAVHFLFRPLDVLWFVIARRFGI
ncbi:MAG: Wzz/FepE/Etk N-terminal domain-containing protein [Steroidobacteraceae bacterium]